MITPGEVKFELTRKLLECARGGRVPEIAGIYSVDLAGNTVQIAYDLDPSPDGDLLYFEFERPVLVSKEDVREFAVWLMSDCGETIH